MTINTVRWYLDLFDKLGLAARIDGGWGVDALLGKQTRPHEDLDIMIPHIDSRTLVDALFESGFEDVHTDDRVDENFVMGHPIYGRIDFHVFEPLEDGGGVYRPGSEDWVMTAGELSATGTIGDRPVQCMSAEYQVRSHSGYILQAADLSDMAALHDHLGVHLLEEHLQALKRLN